MSLELNDILRLHAKAYAKSEPQDAAKLVYQNEFGGGHLIVDLPRAKDRLFEEYERTFRAEEKIEPIGNGLVRVYLCGVKKENLESLFDGFVRSANEIHGDKATFEKKLNILRELTSRGEMPFSLSALDEFLKEYAEAGYPLLSHSERYRELYRPAYRVIKEKYLY